MIGTRSMKSLVLVALLSACASPQRMGMVVDPQTGLQFGSVIERNVVVDPRQFANREVRVRIRNTSGDPTFDLRSFQGAIEDALRSKGYSPVVADTYGLLYDVNVMYSGQATTSLTREFAFLGAAAGGILGYRGNAQAGTAIGVLSGATLGSIIGSNVTDDTYIVVAQVTLGVLDSARAQKETTIQFGAADQIRRQEPAMQGLRDSVGTHVAVFAGGRNTTQRQVAGEVRSRFARIISDVI